MSDYRGRGHEAVRQGIIVRHPPIAAGRQQPEHGDDGGRQYDPAFPRRRCIHQLGQGRQVRCSGGEIEPVKPLLDIGGTAVAFPTKAFA